MMTDENRLLMSGFTKTNVNRTYQKVSIFKDKDGKTKRSIEKITLDRNGYVIKQDMTIK